MPKLTRRGFLQGSALAAGAYALLSSLTGCKQSSSDTTNTPAVISDDSAQDILKDFSEGTVPTETHAFTLPLGTILTPAQGVWIPALVAGERAEPMVKASVVSLATGKLFDIRTEPVNSINTHVIYQVGGSDTLFAWTELHVLESSWELYAQPIHNGQPAGDALKLWASDSNFDPAAFVVVQDRVLWQVQPALSGTKTQEASRCYQWHVGQTDATVVLESPGRFACPLQVSGTMVTLVPRVLPEKGVYYAAQTYEIGDVLGKPLAQLTFPQSVRPLCVTRIGERFVVSIEASYATGGLLSQMGTYIGTEETGFMKFNREPLVCPCGTANKLVIKSRSSYLVCDLEARTYAALGSADRSVDYGEFPVRVGTCDQFATYSTVKDPDTGYPKSVLLRTFNL